MGLSYTGKSCLLMTLLIGYKRVPDPPASIMPFIFILQVCVSRARVGGRPGQVSLDQLINRQCGGTKGLFVCPRSWPAGPLAVWPAVSAFSEEALPGSSLRRRRIYEFNPRNRRLFSP